MPQLHKRNGRAKSPELLLVISCRRAIIDNDDNLASLIDILQDVTLSTGEVSFATSKDPRVAALPWHIFTIWKRAAEEVETFVQTIQLVDPNGKRLLSHDQEFSTTHPTYRIRVRFKVFPVTVPGEYWLKAFIRSPTAQRKSEVGRYPLNIKFSDEAPSRTD